MILCLLLDGWGERAHSPALAFSTKGNMTELTKQAFALYVRLNADELRDLNTMILAAGIMAGTVQVEERPKLGRPRGSRNKARTAQQRLDDDTELRLNEIVAQAVEV